MAEQNPLADLLRLTAQSFVPETGDYAELVDEADPDGLVRICRKDGTPIAFMSRATYEEFRRQAGV